MRAFLKLFLLSVLSFKIGAEVLPGTGYTLGSDKQVRVHVELFLSSTCPHCQREEAFFKGLALRNPWVQVQVHLINQDKNALLRFAQLLKEQQIDDFSVPSAFFCNSRWMGYSQDATTGKDIEQALQYCKKQLEAHGRLTPTAVAVLKRWANANYLSTGLVTIPVSFSSLVFMALMDAFNPCSLCCLLVFFAVLFVQKTKKEQIVIGSLLIVTLNLVHFFQQVFAEVFFEWLAWMRLPAAIVGCLLAYCLVQLYKSKPIHSWVFLLTAALVQAYQQSCLVNWAYLFEKWVQDQQFLPIEILLWQLAYQLIYLLPPILVLIVYTVILNREYFTWMRKQSRTMGMAILGVIAVMMVLFPLGFSSLGFSIGLLMGALMLHFLLQYLSKSP